MRNSMKDDWNERAERDVLYYILNMDKYRDIRVFNQAGIEDANRILTSVASLIKNRESVLDVGCGIGRVLKYVSQCFDCAYGVDVSDQMIRMASVFLKHCENISLYDINGESFPQITNSSIDLAYATLVFEHLPTKEIGFNLIREIYRVLVLDGLFYLNIALSKKSTMVGNTWDGVHWELGEICGAFKNIGFEVVASKLGLPSSLIWDSMLTIIGKK